MSKETIINKLNRIKEEIMNEKDISYSEIAYLESHKQEILELGDIVLAQWSSISDAEWDRRELYNEKYYVGREVIISGCTDDEELNEFTSQYGYRIVITDIEGDYFWGVVMKHKVSCPYHMEYRDIVEFTGFEYPNITNNLSEFTNVEQCQYCGEFFADEDIKEGKCSRCTRAVEEHV